MKYLNTSPIIYSSGEVSYENRFEIRRTYEILTIDKYNKWTYCGLHERKLNLAVF